MSDPMPRSADYWAAWRHHSDFIRAAKWNRRASKPGPDGTSSESGSDSAAGRAPRASDVRRDDAPRI